MTSNTAVSPELNRVAALLEDELYECHAAVMAAFRFAETHPDPKAQLEAMKAGSRMMQASANAACALRRLRSPGTHHTVTVQSAPAAGEGGDTTPEKSKTNNHE
ncbi:MAG TPA: hypothetical protein VMS78_11125 [Rhizomicrobium sp.]|nr:hypothetical protein [Rhizomicrobium sp.]